MNLILCEHGESFDNFRAVGGCHRYILTNAQSFLHNNIQNIAYGTVVPKFI